jgi:hypothetical protein
MTPRIAFGATPLEGGRHWRPGKAGSAVSWVLGHFARCGLVNFTKNF